MIIAQLVFLRPLDPIPFQLIRGIFFRFEKYFKRVSQILIVYLAKFIVRYPSENYIFISQMIFLLR